MGGGWGGGRGLHGGKATSTDNKQQHQQQTNKQTKTTTKPKQQLVFLQQALGTKVSRVCCVPWWEVFLPHPVGQFYLLCDNVQPCHSDHHAPQGPRREPSNRWRATIRRRSWHCCRVTASLVFSYTLFRTPPTYNKSNTVEYCWGFFFLRVIRFSTHPSTTVTNRKQIH